MNASPGTRILEWDDTHHSVLSIAASDWEFSALPLLVPNAYCVLCLQGEVHLFVNGLDLKLQPHSLCCIIPHSIIQVEFVTTDFKGYMMACPTALLKMVLPSFGPSLHQLFRYRPCIVLTADEKRTLLSYIRFVDEQQCVAKRLFQAEVRNHVTHALIYEIVGFYHQRISELSVCTQDAKQRHFLRFEALLARHYAEEREVGFYADRLCITKHYLSRICLQMTQQTATDYINTYVMNHLRVHLRSSDCTILQLSEQFNFANPSHFSQYFRRHEGITPKAYREMFAKQTELE